MIPHPERIALHNEIHARPRPRVSSPCLVSHLALLRPAGAASSPAALRELCLQYGIAPPGEGQSHFFGDFARFRLKWERHGEFDDYTVYRNLMRADDPFGEPAIEALPTGWLAGVEGQLVAAVHLALVPDGPQWAHRDRVAAALGASDLIGADITDGAAVLYTDLHLDPNGYTRFMLINRSMNASLAGRHLQRLLELEVYRMMAMLGFPVARGAAAELNELERGLGALVCRLESAPAEEEPEMLNEVTRLAALAERIASETGFRTGASRAYHALVRQRLADLREQRVSGLETVTEVLERRFTPAMAFCDSVDRRLAAAAERIDRASNLLRTRVEIEREAQNQLLLGAMNRRAKLQLRLQQTVEGLSVVAISYYAIAVLGYVFKGMETLGLNINPDLASGIAVAPVVVFVALAVRRLRRSASSERDPL